MGSSPSSQSKLVLYELPFSAPCRAVKMTAAAAQITLELKFVDLMAGEHKGEEFLKINPEHTVPTLVDGSFTLWESRAIMPYLMNKFAPASELYPRDPARRAIVDRVLQYDLGHVYRTISQFIYPQLFENKEADPEREAAIKPVLDYLDNILEKQQFVAGTNLTIADFSVESNMGILDTKGWDFSAWKNLKAWRERLTQYPWYSEANKGLFEFIKKATGGGE